MPAATSFLLQVGRERDNARGLQGAPAVDHLWHSEWLGGGGGSGDSGRGVGDGAGAGSKVAVGARDGGNHEEAVAVGAATQAHLPRDATLGDFFVAVNSYRTPACGRKGKGRVQ